MTSYVLGIVASALSLVVVIELLRRRHLRERHAIWWFIAGLLALLVGIFPSVLTWAAALVGVAVPTNLIFFVSIAILFFVCLQHSSEVTRLENNARTLAEIIAIHELHLRQLDERLKASGVDRTADSDQ